MGTDLTLRDEDCEKVVLGTIITDRDALDETGGMLSVECFYNAFHAEIYKAVCQIAESGGRPDLIAVRARLAANGVEFSLVEYMRIAACHTYDVYTHACRLRDLHTRRRFYDIGQYLVGSSYSEAEDIEDVAGKAVDDLSGLFRSGVKAAISTIGDALEGVYGMIDGNLSGGSPVTGTPTGFRQLDARSGGLQKSDLVVIAGETSQGKTSMAVSVMRNAALSGAKIAMYSMEMRKEQIAARILSMESGVPANEILYAPLPEAKIQAVDRGIGKMVGMGIYFDDSSTSNIDTIISSVRFMKMRYGIGGAVVDYLQILNVNMKSANKEQQMGDVARRLKNLAKDLDIWIIALSQLSRDRDNPAPSLARLRDSGQIAEAADVVMLIYRPEAYGRPYPGEFSGVDTKGTAMVDIAKGRNIGTLRFICGFDAGTTCFRDLDSLPPAGDGGGADENPF